MDVPPPAHPPPLLSGAALQQLCTDGYVGLDLRPQLAADMAALRAASDAFFALPVADKDPFRPGSVRGPPCHPKNTERGYSRLPGEKEYLTLRRSLSHLPATADLPALAATVWRDAAFLLHRILGDIGVYLGLGPAAWDAVVADSLEPGCYGPAGDGRDDPPTLLRLFRYEPGGGGAERHRDLGLLTLCVCWGRGLQVLPPGTADAGANVDADWIDAPTVTVMTGDTLHVLSSLRIPSAVHRVVVDEPSASAATASRRSIVFALRATTVGDIDLAAFGGEGSVSARELYDGIRHQRVNINTSKETQSAMRAKFQQAAPRPGDAAVSLVETRADDGTDMDTRDRVGPIGVA